MIRNSLAALVLALVFAASAFAATPVDVNHANAATIANSLDGVGISKANAIVAWRSAHGSFKTVDDLRQVKGMGDKTLERNHNAIRFSGGAKLSGKPHARKSTAKAKSRKH